MQIDSLTRQYLLSQEFVLGMGQSASNATMNWSPWTQEVCVLREQIRNYNKNTTKTNQKVFACNSPSERH